MLWPLIITHALLGSSHGDLHSHERWIDVMQCSIVARWGNIVGIVCVCCLIGDQLDCN